MGFPIVWISSSDPETLHLIRLNLERRDFQTLAFNPSEPSAHALSQPNLLILDLAANWALDSGQIARIRGSAPTQSVPLILLTHKAPSDNQLDLFQPVRWLEKPISVAGLLDLVWESLQTV